jgi:hypothetical protein
MARKLMLINLLYVIFSLASVSAGQEENISEGERTTYSDAVFDGTVEKVTQVGVIDEYQTLWKATVLLKTVVKGKELSQVTRISLFYPGPNGQKMRVCPSPPRIGPQMKARFYAQRQDLPGFKKVLFIQSDQWLLRRKGFS